MLKNGMFEELGAVIGAGAALRLAGWQDGAPVYIPSKPTPDHRLCAILAPDDRDAGFVLLAHLVAAFGGETVCLPRASDLDYMRRRGEIFRYLRDGVGVRCIAREVGMTERQVQNHRRWLEEAGLLPMVLGTQPTTDQLSLGLEMRTQARR